MVEAKNGAGTSAAATTQAQAGGIWLHITDHPTVPTVNGATDYANPWAVHIPSGYKVSGKPVTGGWIAQHVSVNRTVNAANGNAVAGDNTTQNYWEAWPVDGAGNVKGSVDFKGPDGPVDPNGFQDGDTNVPVDGEDHFFSRPATKPSSGNVEWSTTAYFYPNLQLPSSFTLGGGGSWPGRLPSTKTDPGLTPPQGEVPVVRDVTVTWDSILGSKPVETTDVREMEGDKHVEYKNGQKTVLSN